jgi:type I restriction enzyme, S subunit
MKWPKDWKETTLGDEIELFYGKSLPKEGRHGGQFPVYGSNGIVGYHDEFFVQGPGLVIGRKGSCGEVHYVPSDFWPIDTTYYVKLKKEHNLLFIFYYLKTLRLNEMNSHSTIPGLNRDLVYRLEGRFPPLPEQKKIAVVLFKIQAAIEIQESLIQRTHELKKSTMQFVFTHGLRGEKTKQTEIGEIPESWEVAKVGEHCDKPEYGLTESAVSTEVGPKFLRITDITDNGVNWHEVPYCHCPKDLLKKHQLQDNDILFARIGATTGKSYLVKNPPFAVFASYLIRLTIRKTVEPLFLSQFFNSEKYWSQINATKQGSLKGGVNGSVLSKILFPMPNKKYQQEEISRSLDCLDKNIKLHIAKKTILQDLFKTMLNKLMTAEIRVNNLDIEVEDIGGKNG